MFGIDLWPWFMFGAGFVVAVVIMCCLVAAFSDDSATDERRGRIARYIVRQQAMKHKLAESDITWCLNELARELPFPLVTADGDVQGTAEQWFATWFEYNRNYLVTPAVLESAPADGWEQPVSN